MTTATSLTNTSSHTSPIGGWRVDVRIAGIWWVISRAVYVLAALILGWTGHVTRPDTGLPWPLDAYQRWDGIHMIRIATEGYFNSATELGRPVYDEAFFPGFPMLVRLITAPVFGMHPPVAVAVVTATVVAWLAALGAGIILVRITREFLAPHVSRIASSGADKVSGTGVGAHAAAGVFLLGPYSVFLMAPYTEGLFTLCAAACWYLAMHRRWNWALVAAAGASILRINGLFLLPMLLVMILAQGWPRPNRSWWRVFSLAIPLIPPLIYLAYLGVHTGDPLHWFHVQDKGWGRESTWIWSTVIKSAKHIAQDPWYIGYQQIMEFVFVGIFLAALWWCWKQRRFDWFVFAAITLVSLSRGSVFLSIPRNGLDCFPVMLAMAAAVTAARGKWRWLLIGLMVAVAAANTFTILADQWTG